MLKKMMLFWLFVTVLAGCLFANGVDCRERDYKTEEEKQKMAERIKTSYFAELDSLIASNKPIISENEDYSDESIIKMFGGDSRQIIIFYKYMLYGDKFTQKKAIDGMVRWYGNPKRVEKLKQDSIFVNYRYPIINKIYEFLDDKYPVLQVTAARTLVYMGIDDSLVIQKLKYYANGTDSQNWNLENTIIYYTTGNFYEENKKRQKATKEIKDVAKIGLDIIKSGNKKENLQIQENKKFNHFNIERNRDLDWDGNSSSDYCELYWGPEITDYNLNYANYVGNDCANFASQCLIAGYYEDITYAPNANGEGCIVNCGSLHNFLSTQSDVDTEIVDFDLNGWENLSEPNNHIPAIFSVGDIVILGKQMWGADSLYQHAIICHKIEGGDHYFGAHTGNRINKRMSWFISPGDNYWDYATFYHITNNWNCNAQIAGGNVSGTWTHENSPYCITGEITIPLGSQLIIEPGVDVIFTGQHKFNIYGTLLANGDWQRYINFTSQDTITGWEGLHFINQNSNGQSNSELTFCKLKYGRATGGYPNFFGGAVHCDDSSPVIEDCLFQSNTADGGGGAICLYNWSSPDIRRSRFANNSSGDGGAIYIWNQDYCYSYPLFEKLIFDNNSASNTSGAIYLYKNVYPVLINCTFYQNTDSGTVNAGALYCYDNCNANIFNTIMWQDSAPELYIDNNCSAEIHDCDLTNGDSSFILGMYSWITFEGNILASDPQFVDAPNGNFNLQWSSPCIDMGATVTIRDEYRNFRQYREDDGTLPDIGAKSYYQLDYVNQSTDLTVSTENDSLHLDWIHGDGAIYYKIYESLEPYNSFTVIDTAFGKTDYSKPISNDNNFYKVAGANNRTSREKSNSYNNFYTK